MLFSSLNCGSSQQNSSFSQITRPKFSRPLIHQSQKVSYNLENLLLTDLSEKDLSLYVYIQESEKIWDYHEYKEELFGYIKDFFKKYGINCKITYSQDLLAGFNSAEVVGVEILDSDKSFEERYSKLCDQHPEKIKKKNSLSTLKGYAVTEIGISLINGGWEEFRDDMSREEVEEQFKEEINEITKKEFILRQNAGNICHEVLHCLGLFHPSDLPSVVKEFEGKIPNIMTGYPLQFSREYPLGSCLTPIQIRMIHSFISQDTFYKCFCDSNRELETFLKRISEENNLRLAN